MNKKEDIISLIEEAKEFTSKDEKEIEDFRIKFLGKKGIIKGLFEDIKKADNESRKELGSFINDLKNVCLEKINSQKRKEKNKSKDIWEDLSRDINLFELGSSHPIKIIKDEISNIFLKIGYRISEGPEIEDDWHNFTALNIPEHHPARDMQDTFFIDSKEPYLLRTHTSSVQIRYMQNNKPPIRIISPGRVFRNETISHRSHCIFHQIEGLCVDRSISLGDLKWTLEYFIKNLFGKTKIRLRPSYFPFTEPSAEVDIYMGVETEENFKLTKGTGWLEIMGCGMVDPKVLKNCDIDPDVYSGFAWGLGIERVAMLMYNIKDIRSFFENDIRFIKQFKKEF